jgi:hypothetical protein
VFDVVYNVVMAQDVTTTAGERFSASESAKLAFLVFKRFGRDVAAAASAWRRLLGNSTPDAAFEALATEGAAIVSEESRPLRPTMRGMDGYQV